MTLVIAALERLGTRCTSVEDEPDNAEYGAGTCAADQWTLRLRVGQSTPTKPGLFVSAWRRAPDGTTQPFPAEDDMDLLVIAGRDGSRFGAFVFPKDALVEHGMVSVRGGGGKRGFRVYPPWSATVNAQAQRTQRWQCEYFLEIGDGSDVDATRARRLFQLA